MKIFVMCFWAAGYLAILNPGPLLGQEVLNDQSGYILLVENDGFEYLYASSRKRRQRWERQEREREELKKQEELKKLQAKIDKIKRQRFKEINQVHKCHL